MNELQRELFLRIQNDNFDIQDILDLGIDINVRAEHGSGVAWYCEGKTPLQAAIYKLFLRIQNDNFDIQDILDLGIDVNVRAEPGSGVVWYFEGKTPLQAAIYKGSVECVKQLLEYGARIPGDNAKDFIDYMNDNHAESWFYSVTGEKQSQIANLILIKEMLESSDLGSSLFKAVSIGSKDMMDILITKGADIQYKDASGSTILHEATKNFQVHLIEEIIQKGVDINALDNNGHTALYYASEGGNLEITTLLLARNAHPDVTNSEELFFADIDNIVRNDVNLSPNDQNAIVNYAKSHIHDNPLSARNHDFFIELCKLANGSTGEAAEESWNQLVQHDDVHEFAREVEGKLSQYMQHHGDLPDIN